MGMFFTRDAWDDARDERIAQIGLVAYEKEVAEYERKYKEDHPEQFRWSISEPKVIYGDMIAIWNEEKQKTENEAVVKGIAENGEITVSYLDNRRDGQLSVWQGEYRKICSTFEINKYGKGKEEGAEVS